MLYEIKWESNGAEGSRMVRADSEEDALARFIEDYEWYDDQPPPGECVWVAGCWSQSN